MPKVKKEKGPSDYGKQGNIFQNTGLFFLHYLLLFFN